MRTTDEQLIRELNDPTATVAEAYRLAAAFASPAALDLARRARIGRPKHPPREARGEATHPRLGA